MDLIPPLQLGAQNLLDSLCPESNYLPYWHMSVDQGRTAEYQFRPYCTGHNIGRWWNTLLRLEKSMGYELPAAIEAAMLENTWRLADNPAGILLEDQDPANAHTWYIHSYRETMLALGLLVQYRDSQQAADQGLQAIERMAHASANLHRWRFDPGAGSPAVEPQGRGADPVYTHGRAIEGLLCYYRATGAPQALDEARRLADFHHRHTVTADGSLAPGCGHHTHSYLNTVRGLIELAVIQNQQHRLDELLATYRKALVPMITPSGFIAHDIGARHGGDIASAGDIAHIALLLWDHCRQPDLLDHAERLVRARLIPAQVTAPPPLTPRQNQNRDCYRDLPQRFVGTIGGSVGHAKGQTCVTDFTAAALHSLVELHDRAIDIEEDCVRVNFHFDKKLNDIQVSTHRRDNQGHLTIDNHIGKSLQVRVPLWADPEAVRIQLNGNVAPLNLINGFAQLPATEGPSRIQLSYSLTETRTPELWRDEWADREEITFIWRGDEIAAVDPLGPYMPPYAKECPSIS
ncbi:MAG: hypothetical protein GKR89_22215 [Candidatus Latescibacteria bacterium]|nr:hypothetical protein [Candidatus Latescibacterota bacterium]